MLIYVADDLLRIYTNLPIAAGDIITLALSGFSLYAGQFIIWHHKDNKQKNEKITQSFWRLLGILIFTISITPLFLWISVVGWMEPTALFETYRGSRNHGYSLGVVGGTVAIYSIGFSILTIDKIMRLYHE